MGSADVMGFASPLFGCEPSGRQESLGARFPLFVDLRGADCLVVGAGAIGMRRVRVLCGFGAHVTVCDPALAGALPELPAGSKVLARAWQPGDERARALVVAATSSREANHAVSLACRAAGIPVSVSDDPGDCTFFFPAICESERLCAGVVSHGAEHALTARAARAVRETLAEVEGEVSAS